MSNADCDAPSSAPLVAEEDSRTTSFLEALPKDLLVVERRDLIPVAASWSSNYNHTGPVQYGDKVYVLKEPAVSALVKSHGARYAPAASAIC